MDWRRAVILFVSSLYLLTLQWPASTAAKQVSKFQSKLIARMTASDEQQSDIVRELSSRGFEWDNISFDDDQHPDSEALNLSLKLGLNDETCGKGNFRYMGESAFDCNAKYYGAGDEYESSETDNEGGSRRRTQRISGGFRVQTGQFPSYARLLIRNDENKLINCGGTLLSDRVIITAAHCVQLPPHEMVGGVAILGVSSLHEDRGQIIGISRSCSHPKVHVDSERQSIYNDVAILILKKRARFDARVQPACLASRQRHNSEALCFTVGMGRTSSFDMALDVLYGSPVRRKCGPGYDEAGRDGVSCYMGQSSRFVGNACPGDSGGPIYCFSRCGGNLRQYVVAGVSFGPDVCQRGVRKEDFNADYHQMGPEIESLIEDCASGAVGLELGRRRFA